MKNWIAIFSIIVGGEYSINLDQALRFERARGHELRDEDDVFALR